MNTPVPKQEKKSQDQGIASQYPGDEGIENYLKSNLLQNRGEVVSFSD